MRQIKTNICTQWPLTHRANCGGGEEELRLCSND